MYQQVETTVSGPDGNGVRQSENLQYNLFFYTYTDFKGNTQSIWLASRFIIFLTLVDLLYCKL
jgi:hypothetical protein